MRILFLSRWFPYPATNGSKLRIYNLLRELARENQVTLLSLIDDAKNKINTGGLDAIVDEVRTAPLRVFKPDFVRARSGLLSPKPRFIVDTFSPVFANLIRESVARKPFDVVLASQIDTAMYRNDFRAIPAIFEEVEVAILYERFAHAGSWHRRVRAGITWFKHRRYLASLLSRFQACTFASEEERRLVVRVVGCPTRSEVVPNSVDVSSYTGIGGQPQRNEWIFTGSLNYAPNHEAAVWFIKHVLPLILLAVPDFRLTITGHTDNPLPDHPSVSLSGFVDDIRPLIARSWGSLAPMRTGGGTRVKILEAMALRTPVVSTSKGAEGLEFVPGRHLLIGDTPRQFAEQVIRLSGDPTLRDELSCRSLELVEAKYDAGIAGRRLLKLIDSVVRVERSPQTFQLKPQGSPLARSRGRHGIDGC